MSNLIITLISIALVAAVAVAALYNGGDAFRQGSAKSSAAQLVNAGQQISAANLLYANDHSGTYMSGNIDGTDELTTDGEYLSSTPRVPEGFGTPEVLADNVISIVAASGADEICKAVNAQAGYGDDEVLTNASAVTKGFGCHAADSGDSQTFIFK